MTERVGCHLPSSRTALNSEVKLMQLKARKLFDHAEGSHQSEGSKELTTTDRSAGAPIETAMTRTGATLGLFE